MNELISAIKQDLNDRNWFAALFLTLTLPDICGAMESPTDANGKRYKRWYENYLAESYQRFSAEDCWRLRNSCLHECSDRDARMAFMRVHFVEPNENKNIIIHNNILNNVLQFQIDKFCNDFCNAAEKWLENIRNNQDVINRIDELI